MNTERYSSKQQKLKQSSEHTYSFTPTFVQVERSEPNSMRKREIKPKTIKSNSPNSVTFNSVELIKNINSSVVCIVIAIDRRLFAILGTVTLGKEIGFHFECVIQAVNRIEQCSLEFFFWCIVKENLHELYIKKIEKHFFIDRIRKIPL